LITKGEEIKAGKHAISSIHQNHHQSLPQTTQVSFQPQKVSRRQPGIRGSNEATGSKPGVTDESIVVYATSSEGTGTKPGVSDEDKDITKEKVILKWGDEEESEYSDDDNDDIEKDDKEGNVDDEGDNDISDTQDADDEDVKTKCDEDEIYKYRICVCKYEDVEMKNVKVEESDKGDEDVTDVEKEDAEKTSEVKNDTKKIKLPPTSSSLSVSSGFGDQFLKLSFDLSLISTVKDSAYVDVPKNQTPIVDLERESKKITSEILKIKKEQAEKQKMPKFTIKSTYNAAIEKYDLKSALYQIMHANKSFNKNHANHQLYHALMEALIEDENAKDKGVADADKKTKRRRTKESKSFKKQSTTKETPKGKASSKGSKSGKSSSAKEPVKETIAEVVMDDAVTMWHDLEWNKRQVVLDQPEQPWFNQMVFAIKNPLTFNDLMATLIDFFKYVLSRLKIDNLTQDILLGPAYNLLKGDCYPFDMSKPLPLQGHPGDFVDLHLNEIKDMLLLAIQHKLFHLTDSDIVDFIVALQMPMIKWTAIDIKRLKLMVELIDKQMRERRIIRNLERLVGAQELKMGYKLMTRTT
nr:hypothetical protein [Tanacetum cinerariifolium]